MKKSHSKHYEDICPGCGYYPCQDTTIGCETSGVTKAKYPTKFQLCLECEEVREIAFDGNLKEYFCINCGCTVGDTNMKLPESIKKGGSSYSTGYQGGTTLYDINYQYTACDHTGEKVIFEHEGKKLYGANNKGLNEYSGAWGLIIDLAGIVDTPSPGFIKQASPKKFDHLRKYTGKYIEPKSEILRLDWPDYAAPAVTPDFWTELWKILPEKTAICCQGGHGRTGTCLAAFMISQGVDYYSAFTTVRTEHCTKAIESLSQARYLHGLYIHMLKLRLTAATASGDLVQATALGETLQTASKNVPRQDNLLGDDDTPVDIPTTPKGGGSTYKSLNNEKVVLSDQPDRIVNNSPKRHCPKCGAWINKSVNWNDYWCSTCRNRVDPKTSLSETIDDGKDFVQETLKRVGGVLYLKTCITNTCDKAEHDECDDPDHLVWIKWDDYQHLEASVE